MKTRTLNIETGAARAIIDLTDDVKMFVAGEGDGLVNVSLPHATAGLALMELGAGTEEDLWASIDRILPSDARYAHSHGSKGHGASHVLPIYLTPTLTLPVQGGKARLGTWQSIALIDPNVDNRSREVLLAFIESK